MQGYSQTGSTGAGIALILHLSDERHLFRAGEVAYVDDEKGSVIPAVTC